MVTASCNKDAGDVGEDELEELVDRPRTTNRNVVRRVAFYPSCNFWWVVVSDHWSNGNKTRDLLRVFRVREPPGVSSREALLSRLDPILWHTLLPLLLWALRCWLSTTVVGFLGDFYGFQIGWVQVFTCSPCAHSRRNLQQILFPAVLWWMRTWQTPLIGRWEGSSVRFFVAQ